ncbi:TrmB family transcriptional regulator [Halorubraceae archaeon YAN]|nr:TrmB family transcriptional regulator [Halorubraceae archaeon YAN]
MSDTPTNTPRSVAIEQLEALGLSAYAARTFVALTTLQCGTAQEVSEVSDVPRTRVYDAVTELKERGLVEIQQSVPKQFWAISAQTAGTKLTQEYQGRIETLVEMLTQIRPQHASTRAEQLEILHHTEAVENRIQEMLESATETIIYGIYQHPSQHVMSHLTNATNRGVSVTIGVGPQITESTIEQLRSSQITIEHITDAVENPIGQLLIVDDTTACISAPIDEQSQMQAAAVYADGKMNAVNTIIHEIVTARFNNH